MFSRRQRREELETISEGTGEDCVPAYFIEFVARVVPRVPRNLPEAVYRDLPTTEIKRRLRVAFDPVMPLMLRKQYPIIVGRGLSLSELYAEGPWCRQNAVSVDLGRDTVTRYDRIFSNVVEDKYAFLPDLPARATIVETVEFTHRIDEPEMLAELAREGLQLANLEEALTFGATFPEAIPQGTREGIMCPGVIQKDTSPGGGGRGITALISRLPPRWPGEDERPREYYFSASFGGEYPRKYHPGYDTILAARL